MSISYNLVLGADTFNSEIKTQNMSFAASFPDLVGGGGIERNPANEGVFRQGFLSTGITQSKVDDAKIQPHEIGATAEVKPLYEGPRVYCTCCKVWDDEKPVGHDDAHRREMAEKQRQKYAILQRQCRHGHGTWKTNSIVINSKPLRHRLVSVFQDYPAVDPHAVELSFSTPFLPFVHRWDQLTQVLKAEKDEEAQKHLTLLIDLLHPEIEGSFEKLRNIQSTGFVTFDDLTLVYMSGEKVIQSQAGVVFAGVLRGVNFMEQAGAYFFSVDVVDWNGDVFGVRKDLWKLFIYEGSRPLKELPILPLRCVQDPSGIEKVLVSRGKDFQRLAGCYFRSYTGKATIRKTHIPVSLT